MTGPVRPRDSKPSRSRELNETVARTNAVALADGGTAVFACECGDDSCGSEVCLTGAQYERVRGIASQFLIRRDHENPESEWVLFEDDAWAIVVAVGKDAVMAARSTDPRAVGHKGG
jgi:hypothetical protein